MWKGDNFLDGLRPLMGLAAAMQEISDLVRCYVQPAAAEVCGLPISGTAKVTALASKN
jgi:hypothetical protein